MASAVAMGAVASAGLWALTDVSPARAQTMQDVLPAPGARPAPEQRPESPPADASASEAPAPDLSTEAGRAARLDQLFADLPLVDDVQAEKMEAEIQRLWARSGSDTMDLILTRGRIALEQDEVVKALHHFTAVTDHDPEFAEGWNMRATAFFIHGDLGMALSDIERVLALEPRHYGALSGLGVILEQIGREADALAAFREAQRVNPHLENVEEAIERLAHRVDGRDI